MSLADTSQILLDGMRSTLDSWAARFGGEKELLYWHLRGKLDQLSGGSWIESAGKVPTDLRGDFEALAKRTDDYWGDVRYSALEPVTQLWGTIVNSVRAAAESPRLTDGQRELFKFPAESLVNFFHAARDRMEVADALYHVFKAMPAPELQALAALLNVHVDARLEANTMVRLVRLLDHEGPMTPEETKDLASISNTHLVDAAFSGLRAHA